MNKVKSVVSKFFRPSFLFADDNQEDDRSKRKRSLSTEQNEDVQSERSTVDTTRMSKLQYHRSVLKTKDERNEDDEIYKIDNKVDEQQTKRRRTADYQHIQLTEKSTENIERSTSYSNSRTTFSDPWTENRTKIVDKNPITPKKSVNDSLNSPLFPMTAQNRSLQTDDRYAPSYLLATSLANQAKSTVSNKFSPVPTLTNPNFSTSIRSDSYLLGRSCALSYPRRLPYIERLRLRTLHDVSQLQEKNPKDLTTTELSSDQKQKEKTFEDVAVQCDSKPIEENRPSSIQTESSIIIEPRIPESDAQAVPKVLGDVTPFSWPNFARAQDTFAQKNPLKCAQYQFLNSTNNDPIKPIFEFTSKSIQPNASTTTTTTRETEKTFPTDTNFSFGTPISSIKFGMISTFSTPTTNFNNSTFVTNSSHSDGTESNIPSKSSTNLQIPFVSPNASSLFRFGQSSTLNTTTNPSTTQLNSAIQNPTFGLPFTTNPFNINPMSNFGTVATSNSSFLFGTQYSSKTNYNDSSDTSEDNHRTSKRHRT